jgi:hypothetical protein
VTDQQDEFETAKSLVEATLQKLGLDPGACRAAAAEHPALTPVGDVSKASWTLKRGSASILLTVTRYGHEKGTYLRAASPVVVLPADAARRNACLQRLLELNAAGLGNAAFGVVGDRVIAVSERPVSGLDAQEVEQIVRHLSAVADTFDDKLGEEFGATRS